MRICQRRRESRQKQAVFNPATTSRTVAATRFNQVESLGKTNQMPQSALFTKTNDQFVFNLIISIQSAITASQYGDWHDVWMLAFPRSVLSTCRRLNSIRLESIKTSTAAPPPPINQEFVLKKENNPDFNLKCTPHILPLASWKSKQWLDCTNNKVKGFAADTDCMFVPIR